VKRKTIQRENSRKISKALTDTRGDGKKKYRGGRTGREMVKRATWLISSWDQENGFFSSGTTRKEKRSRSYLYQPSQGWDLYLDLYAWRLRSGNGEEGEEGDCQWPGHKKRKTSPGWWGKIIGNFFRDAATSKNHPEILEKDRRKSTPASTGKSRGRQTKSPSGLWSA